MRENGLWKRKREILGIIGEVKGFASGGAVSYEPRCRKRAGDAGVFIWYA